jgi:hypothetical protein
MAISEEMRRRVLRSRAVGVMTRRLAAHYAALPPQPMMAVTTHPDYENTILLLSPDPSRPGGWRITRFDSETREPYGHSEYDNYKRAVTDFFEGYRVLKAYSPDGKVI